MEFIMLLSYKILMFSHVGAGFVSLVFFWIAAYAKKGGKLHSKIGHWYAKSMYFVGFSALSLSLMLIIDPLGFKFSGHRFSAEQQAAIIASSRDTGIFLIAISVLVIVGVRHGLQAVRAKGNQALMRREDNLFINITLLVTGVWLGTIATGGSPSSVLFYIFATLCAVTAIINLRFCLKRQVKRTDQIIAHLSSIIGAGIGSHTAFFVFGANRLFAELLSGYFAIIPWVLPSVVGIFFTFQQARKYRPRKVKP